MLVVPFMCEGANVSAIYVMWAFSAPNRKFTQKYFFVFQNFAKKTKLFCYIFLLSLLFSNLKSFGIRIQFFMVAIGGIFIV